MFLMHAHVRAQWSIDPLVNNPISTAPGDQEGPAITSDGAGGAIVTWQDYRSGNSDIYAQRISSGGVVLWTTDGVGLCTASGDQLYPSIAGDDAGGAIVTWDDFRSGTRHEIYAQRINANGVVQWTTNGIALCTANGNHYAPVITSDGSGGAIVAWQDLRGTAGFDIYVQRVNANGIVQWTTNGVALCEALYDQVSPSITSDGAGGAIVSWWDMRSGNYDIYARRISASGVPQWVSGGVALCRAANDQTNAALISDGVGGAICAWVDYRLSNPDIYAQRITASGVVQWTTDGVLLSTTTNNQLESAIISDGVGGAICAWVEEYADAYDIHAQRIDGNGVVQWTTDGVAVTSRAGYYSQPTITGDGAGGAIITWYTLLVFGNEDIYAQRINASGVLQWATSGVSICTAPGYQQAPKIVGESGGGAIMTWQDGRNVLDIYAQNVDAFGNLGTVRQRISAVTDIPNDQGGSVRVKWHKSTADTSIANNQIVSYGLWRRMPPSLSPRKVRTTPQGVMNDSLGSLYDFITSVPAVQSSQYNVVAPTLEDSSSSGSHATLFLVTAHTTNPNQFYLSSVDSGHSVDNLAPLSPGNAALAALSSTKLRLRWDKDLVDHDVGHYAVYRSRTDGFPLVDSTRWAVTTDSVIVDSAFAANAAYYYRITTVDIHGNESVPSGELYSPNALSSKASVRVLLEGAYNTGTQVMNKTLRTSGFLATHFGSIPIPTDAVDSINIELRNSASASGSTTRKFRPAWLLTDGTIRDFADTTASYVTFDTLAGNYYLVISHRNHIAVMTAASQALNGVVPSAPYDFTTSQSQAFGSNPMKAVTGGRFAMIAGDASGNGQVATSDINTFIRPRLGQSGYQNADINLNGQIQTSDINTYARPNLGKGTQVPASPVQNGKKKERL